MYFNTTSAALKGKAVYSVQECLLNMMKERLEETMSISPAKEFLLLETGQSAKVNSVLLNMPLVKL